MAAYEARRRPTRRDRTDYLRPDLPFGRVRTGFFQLGAREADPAINVSISRAARRLERRGLVRIWKMKNSNQERMIVREGQSISWAGIELTDEGEQVANYMVAEKNDRLPEWRITIKCLECGARTVAYYSPRITSHYNNVARKQMFESNQIIQIENCELCSPGFEREAWLVDGDGE